jgi:hypothetical protein
MQEIWFNGTTTKEERDTVKQDIALAFRAFQRLQEILKRKLKTESSFKDYDVANWAYLQADINGYNRALKEILKLTHTEEDK